MPHEFVSGVFGASRPAWHGLGEVREGLLTTDEALTLSGVAEVEASPEPIYARDQPRGISRDPRMARRHSHQQRGRSGGSLRDVRGRELR